MLGLRTERERIADRLRELLGDRVGTDDPDGWVPADAGQPAVHDRLRGTRMSPARRSR